MLGKLLKRGGTKVIIYTQPAWADCHAAKRFFAQEGIVYDERDVTADEKYLKELTETVGRMATPTIVIDDEVLLGFAINRARIETLLAQNQQQGRNHPWNKLR